MSTQGPELRLITSSEAKSAASQELTPERWQQVKVLFAAAQELGRANWSGFLEEACGEDKCLLSTGSPRLEM